MKKITLMPSEAKALLEFMQEMLESKEEFDVWEIIQSHESGIGATTEVRVTLKDDKTVTGVFRNITDMSIW